MRFLLEENYFEQRGHRLRASFHFLFKGQKKRARGTMIEVLQIKNEKKPERLTDMGFAQNRSAGVKARLFVNAKTFVRHG